MPDEPVKIALRLESEGGGLEIRADAPGGEAKAEGPLPDAAVLDEIKDHDPARLPASLQERVGRALYSAVALGDVQDLLFDTLQDATSVRQTVQLEFRFDPKQVGLTAYPWEMICNTRGQFLVRDGLVDLTRYITYPQHPPKFGGNLGDLPLLRVISRPPTLPPITGTQLTIDNIVNISPPTFDEFTKRLLIDRMTLWALQFDGHGALVKVCPNCETANPVEYLACRHCRGSLRDAETCGALAFEDAGPPGGGPAGVRWIPTALFGSLLYNANVPMAVLLACESALTGGDMVFNGVAPGLLLAGVPAVIGMQYAVSDAFANGFANAFYAMLDTGRGLLESLRLARRMNIAEAWYSPVLYLRYRRTAEEEAKLKPISQARTVDTAVPGEVKVGADFFARLWIRRPETRPLTEVELRRELGLPPTAPVDMRAGSVEVELQPVEDRRLRRGEVEVSLRSPACDIVPASIKLFVDEELDAPPAIFTVRARKTGDIALVFNVVQNGVQIHSVVHPIHVTQEEAVAAGLQRASAAIPVIGADALAVGGPRRWEDIPREAEMPADRGYLDETQDRAPTVERPYGGHMAEPPSRGIDWDREASEPPPDQTIEHDWSLDETKERPVVVPPISQPEQEQQPQAATPAATPAPPPPPGRGDSQGGAPMRPEPPVRAAPSKTGGFPMKTLAGALGAVTMLACVGALAFSVLGRPAIANLGGDTPVAEVTFESHIEPTQPSGGDFATPTFEPIETIPTIPATAVPEVEPTEDPGALPTSTPTLIPNIIGDEGTAVVMTVFAFDERLIHLRESGGDAEGVSSLAQGEALERLFAEADALIGKGCFWQFEHRGMDVINVEFNEDNTAAFAEAQIDRSGIFFCQNEAQHEFKGPYTTYYYLEWLDGRWLVMQFDEVFP